MQPYSERAKPLLKGLRFLGFLLPALLVAITFSGADLGKISQLLSAVGLFGFALIALPQIAALSMETHGWCGAFAALGRRVPFFTLLRLRLSTEALAQSLPAGVVVAESTKPILLDRWCNLPVDISVAGMAARKYLLLVSQTAYVLGFALLGYSFLRHASRDVIGAPGLELVAIGCGVGIAALATTTLTLLRGSTLATRLLGMLSRVPVARLRDALARHTQRFAQTDARLRTFFRLPLAKMATLALPFLAAWLLEACETFLILRLLGARVDFVQAAGLEVVLCVVRNVVFFVPAGLGFQDLGYVAFLRALGTPDAVALGAAFVLLKRAKEALWVCVGYAFLITGSGSSHEGAKGLANVPSAAELAAARA